MDVHITSTTRPWLGPLVDTAVRTLDRNVVQDDRGTYIRAGDGYVDPWTRDAALNSWGAAAVLRPDAARATLLRVCERLPDGTLVVAQDDQWWDRMVWVVAARDLALTTGDRTLLRTAFDVGLATFRIQHRERFRPRWGLYAGPALMQDGISGLPTPPATTDEPTSFVLDYPDAHEVMTLSTNVLYVAAARALAATARELAGADGLGGADGPAGANGPAGAGGRPGADGLAGADPDALDAHADRLVAAIRRHLGDGDTFGAFVHGVGAAAGTLDHHREAAGLALAVLYDVAPPGTAHDVLASVGRGRAGAVNVAPHYADRYSDAHPGRHNAMCWPMVMGLVGLAAAAAGDAAGVARTLDDLRALVDRSGGRFDEVHDARTGEPSGGWQCGFLWDSEPNQTWSATSFLRLVHHGVLGLRADLDGLRLAPLRPAGGEVVTATGVPFRAASIDLTIEAGERDSVSVDGDDVTDRAVHLPTGTTGHHVVRVVVAS
ncbi:hypothetical protein [Curtobacterium sp. RRHDQ10]|uniref:hypothetical protein n=1 Tax=Curtobacterium phyllosphaerae TaxID=3413379 RepID=UPI003BF1F6D9